MLLASCIGSRENKLTLKENKNKNKKNIIQGKVQTFIKKKKKNKKEK